MKILTICNHKGGTGKTTTAVNLSAAISLAGIKTLVIDLDPQGFLSDLVGSANPPVERSSLALFDSNISGDQIRPYKLTAFDLIPATLDLTHAMRRLNRPVDVLWLKDSLADIKGYDLILIDTAAALTVYTFNALVASDNVLITVTPEQQPVTGADQTFETCSLVQSKLNPNLADPKFLLTRVDGRKTSHNFFTKYLKNKYNDKIATSIIRTSSSLIWNQELEKSVSVFDRDMSSRGAIDYANAADEVANWLGLNSSYQEPEIKDEPSSQTTLGL